MAEAKMDPRSLEESIIGAMLAVLEKRDEFDEESLQRLTVLAKARNLSDVQEVIAAIRVP